MLQPSIIGVSQGQGAGVRVGSIGTPPSNVNVPNCAAVASHVSSQVSDVQAWVRSQLTGYVTAQQLSTQLADYEAASIWSVSASHANLDQTITTSTALTTSDGVVGYYNGVDLLNDHNLSLPLPGTTSHFVSPQQPEFTFSTPTRVYMIIPTTADVAPIRAAGWIYSPML